MKPLRSRFEKEAHRSVQRYSESVSYDQRLYRQDINVSIAHAQTLAEAGWVSWTEVKQIIDGLNEIREEIAQGRFQFDIALEDIHMNIESRLYEKIGDVAGKLHTGRSRNDQIATDIRLFLKDTVIDTVTLIRRLQQVILDAAEANKSIIIPGYTHLQRAQPVLLAHHLLAYFEMLERDVARFNDCFYRADVSPLGSGALAGIPYRLNRRTASHELGFEHLSTNSIDAVSDRDYLIEYESAASITMMHLSRLAEEIVIWSSAEFGFLELDDAFATSSSIMPQKKNPDVAELARGKTGRVYGNLMAILTTMKGLPLAYNRDLQEDKEGFFQTVDILHGTLDVFSGMVQTMRFNPDRCSQASAEGYALATELADYLARKDMPFREAHATVARLVATAISAGKQLNDLSLAEYQAFSPLFEEDVFSIDVQSAVKARDVYGGTAPKQVDRAIRRARKLVE